MKPPKFARLALIMALLFAFFHLLYAAALFTINDDAARQQKVVTSRQALPFAMDFGLLAGVFLVGILAGRLKRDLVDEEKKAFQNSRIRQYIIIAAAIAVLLLLLTARTYQTPQFGLLLRRHVYMAFIFGLLGLYNQRHFTVTEGEEKRYEALFK